jgi:hypothetical protein
VLQDNPEAACETIQTAISRLQDISTPLMIKRLTPLHAQLQQWKHLSMVQDIDGLLYSLKTTQKELL